MGTELIYGLVDNNGILFNPVVVDSDNLDIIPTLISIHSASNAYLMDCETDEIIIGESRWNGVDWEPKKPIPVVPISEGIADVMEETIPEDNIVL